MGRKHGGLGERLEATGHPSVLIKHLQRAGRSQCRPSAGKLASGHHSQAGTAARILRLNSMMIVYRGTVESSFRCRRRGSGIFHRGCSGAGHHDARLCMFWLLSEILHPVGTANYSGYQQSDRVKLLEGKLGGCSAQQTSMALAGEWATEGDGLGKGRQEGPNWPLPTFPDFIQ